MTDKEWRSARKVIEGFFQPGWKHKRIDEELAHVAEVSSKRRGSANNRWSNKDANAYPNADANAPPDAPTNGYAIGDTLHTSHSVPNGTGEAPDDPKAGLFARARKVLGPKSGGGLTAKLLRSIGPEDDPKTIAKARAFIEQASTKAAPAEYLGRVIAGPAKARTATGELYPEGII